MNVWILYRQYHTNEGLKEIVEGVFKSEASANTEQLRWEFLTTHDWLSWRIEKRELHE